MTTAPTPAYAGPSRVFSGMQPTGGLHLGNYLGALVKFVRLQDEHECIYCVVDLHAITVEHDPKLLQQQCREVTAAYIAAGVDPKKAIIFVQSAVPAHAELAWIFNCVARMGWLERMTQFKDKAGKDREAASSGLYVYPNLMAADILAYHATQVPVGDDQRQHLELANDIAQKFNHDYGADFFFPLPEPLIQGPGARIMSLRDGSKKMSKSDPSDMSRINLTDDAETIANKLKRATTDSLPMPAFDDPKRFESRPEVENLVGIFSALANVTVDEVLKNFVGKGFGEFKPALAEIASQKLSPIAAEMQRLLNDSKVLDDILQDGAARAHEISEPVMSEVRHIVGLWKR